MPRRLVLATLVGALVVASLVAVAGDAAASTPRTKVFELQPKEFLDPDGGDIENWGRETVLTEQAPDKNYKNERYLNTSAEPGRTSATVLRFPLDQPRRTPATVGPLPANVSMTTRGFTNAELTLYYRDAMADDEKGRALDVYGVQKPWDEGALDWNEFQDTSGFISTSRIDRSPEQEALQADAREWDVTPYMAGVLTPKSPEPFDGFLIQDANPDDGNCRDTTVACEQEFYSSNALDRDGAPESCDAVGPTENCLPLLTLDVRMNTPHAHNFTYEGGDDETHVAPGEHLNFTADIWDPIGQLREVLLEVRTEEGEQVRQDSIFGNRSRNVTGDRPDEGSTFKFWRNDTVGLDEGRYTINVSVRDSDGRWTNTSYEETNFTVDATEPTVTDPEVGPRSIETGDTVDFALNASDLYGIERAWAVLENPSRPTVRTDDFLEETVDLESGNGSYTGSYTFEFPGTYNVTLKAQDKPGNVAEVSPCSADPCTVEVEDQEDPTIIASCFRVDGDCTSSDQAQEIDGTLPFELQARDNHPEPVDVRLDLNHLDSGTDRSISEIGKVGSRTWRHNVTFDAGEAWPTGQWEAEWVVTDPDGNTARTTVNLTFGLEEAGPPTLVDFTPTDWDGSETEVAATIQDVNLDRDRIELRVSVNDQAFQGVRSSVAGGGDRVTVTANLGPYIHGDQVAVEVVATDAFNRTTSTVETYTVDDRDPRASLSFDGETLEGLARKVIPSATKVGLAGNDSDSGVDRLEYRVFPRDGSVGDWVPAEGAVNITGAPGYTGEGPYVVEYRALDGAGNAGDSSAADVYVDVEAPTIDWARSPGSVRVTAEDPGAGIEEVRVHYRNASGPFSQLPVELVQKTPDGGVFEADLPFTPRGDPVQVWFAAEDRLGHVATLGEPDTSGQRPIRWKQPNHPPDVEVPSPTPRAQVSGNVPIEWEAADPDGDDIGVEVVARPVVLEETRSIADPLGNPGATTWDTTEVPDGRYEVQVRAQDDRNTTVASVTVDVRNTDLGLAGVSLPSSLEPGQKATLSATIYREVESVEAKIQIDGDGERRTVDTTTLRDDGRAADETAGDGTHAGTLTATEEGSYTTSLKFTYEDGSTEETQEVGTFTAETTFAEQLEANRDVVAAAGAILVVLAVATVVQLYRYGYI
jgi:hypothetical protein